MRLPGDAQEDVAPQEEHRYTSQESLRAGKRKRIVIGVILAAIAVIALAAIAFASFLNAGKGSLVKADTGDAKTVEHQGVTYRLKDNMASICVIGSDFENGGEHLDGFNGQADATMVVALDTETGEAACIAIPRNSMVDVNLQHGGDFRGTKRMQICLAYALGEDDEEGGELMCTTVSRLLYNIPIEHYYTISISGFDALTDAIGGVEVEALEDIPYTDIKKGDVVTLHGADGGEQIVFDSEDVNWTGGTAAWYVRYRDMHEMNSPLARQAREQQFVRAFASQALEAAKSNPSVITDLYNTAAEYSTTNLEASEFAYLASVLTEHGIGTINLITLEGEMTFNDESEWEQYIIDRDALYQTVLDVYYEPVE
ncbi:MULTISPECIES: LCP family protein [unclassified Adlercreutzia]|uniref:LCP family protein n=1 Tax=unclassified Adlercreutzia TaxID=2636013 RepID=UPI0013EC61C2|nr:MULTISPECIES: LCP family protein [unclassified Adlercreutzia]